MTSWNAWLAETQLATSAPSCDPSRERFRSCSVSWAKCFSAWSSASSPSSVILGVASSVARPSSSARTRNASRSSSRERVRTRTPRLGTNETSPSAARRRKASRTGVRETWNCSESCSWRRTVPGAISPETIASSSASARSSALVPTVGMAVSVGLLGGGRCDRVGAVVDADRDQRKRTGAEPVLDQVHEPPLVEVLDLKRDVTVVVHEVGRYAVRGKRGDEPWPVGVTHELDCRQRVSFHRKEENCSASVEPVRASVEL